MYGMLCSTCSYLGKRHFGRLRIFILIFFKTMCFLQCTWFSYYQDSPMVQSIHVTILNSLYLVLRLVSKYAAIKCCSNLCSACLNFAVLSLLLPLLKCLAACPSKRSCYLLVRILPVVRFRAFSVGLIL